MKRAAAFILSLTVIWLQVMASAQTLSSQAAAPQCGCCAGKKACCCVEKSAPDAAPIPIAPVSGPVTVDFHAILVRMIAWNLPAPFSATISPSVSCSISGLAVPLFQRNCALLI